MCPSRADRLGCRAVESAELAEMAGGSSERSPLPERFHPRGGEVIDQRAPPKAVAAGHHQLCPWQAAAVAQAGEGAKD